MFKKRHYKIRIALFIIIIILLIVGVNQTSLVKDNLSNPESLKQWVSSFGLIAPLIIIGLQFFQTTISIIPSQITTIAAGFIFGPFWGLVYSLIGAFFGSMLTFLLARKYGKNLVSKLFEEKEITHLTAIIKKKRGWSLFLARITPIFPNDLVSFVSGLTKMPLNEFNLVSSLGFLIQMVILTHFGSELSQGQISLKLILFTILMILFILVILFKKQAKQLILNHHN